MFRAGFALTILFTKQSRLEFVNVFGILILSGLTGLMGEMLLLNRYWTLSKLDWYGILQLGLEIFLLRIVDAHEENVLRHEREKERKSFRRDL